MTSSATGNAPPIVEPGPAVHDFDFYIGRWRVHHRRLKERLAGSDEWEEFEGTSRAWPILDGAGNIDDNVLELPSGTYRAISLRSFDPATDRWSIWWLDGRNPATSIRRSSAGSRTASGRSRRGHVRRPADPRPLPVVRHHRRRRAAGSRRSRPTAARPGR